VVQRNPHVYEGKYINVNRKKDGTLYPTFIPISFATFSIGSSRSF
jgi:hypothetical protein